MDHLPWSQAGKCFGFEKSMKMDKQSAYELQKIDCNCNDCGFLIRNLDKKNNLIIEDKILQEEMFWLTKNRKIERIQGYIDNLKKYINLIKGADRKIERKTIALDQVKQSSHSYQGDRIPILYGTCTKYGKEISFQPNICQLDTQQCFVHRKDHHPQQQNT